MGSLAERLLRALSTDVVLCLDECDIHLLPALRAMWMRKGEQERIPNPGQNRKRSLFGALEMESGRWYYLVQPRKRAVEFILFLEQLLVAYPSEPLILVLDNASIHSSRALLAWLAEHPRIELLYLPAYSGHRENPVEKVWWRLKDEVASDGLHARMDAPELATHRFFASFTPEAALRLAARKLKKTSAYLLRLYEVWLYRWGAPTSLSFRESRLNVVSAAPGSERRTKNPLSAIE